jgi:HK97 gp10 family phage protein
MTDSVKFKFEGMKEFEALLKEMQQDFEEKTSKKILNRAVRKAMGSVLESAKRLVPVDTGALRASLRLEVRKPGRRDKRSKYVEPTDIVIGSVTTAPGNVLAKKKFINQRTGKEQIGINSDARAIANEFGTATKSAKPFLRPAMDTEKEKVVGSLADSLKAELEKYRSKYRKKT